MKKTLLLLVAYLFHLPLSAASCEHDLVLVFNGDWAPYIYRINDNRYGGDDYQLLARTLRQLGCDLSVLSMTKRRADKEVNKGTFDFYVGASYTAERNRQFHFSSAYRAETVGYAVAEPLGPNNDHDLSTLMAQGAKVAINMDGYFGEQINQLKARYPSQFVHEFSLPQRIAMITQGIVDIVVDDQLALCKQWSEMNSPSFVVSTQVLHTDDIHYMLNKKTISAEFADAFNDALQRSLVQVAAKPNYCQTANLRLLTNQAK